MSDGKNKSKTVANDFSARGSRRRKKKRQKSGIAVKIFDSEATASWCVLKGSREDREGREGKGVVFLRGLREKQLVPAELYGYPATRLALGVSGTK